MADVSRLDGWATAWNHFEKQVGAMNFMNRSDWKRQATENALPCCRELLQSLRRQRGWTQVELARIVGYSRRLISKAEAGDAISLQAIEDLADAFSTAESLVYPEDLIMDPVIKTKYLLLLLQHHGFIAVESWLAHLDDEVELQIAGRRLAKQCPETAHGKGPVLDVLGQLHTEVGGELLELADVHCLGGGTEVGIWCKIKVKSALTTGSPLVQTSALLEFHRGRIRRMKLMLDTVAWRNILAWPGSMNERGSGNVGSKKNDGT